MKKWRQEQKWTNVSTEVKVPKQYSAKVLLQILYWKMFWTSRSISTAVIQRVPDKTIILFIIIILLLFILLFFFFFKDESVDKMNRVFFQDTLCFNKEVAFVWQSLLDLTFLQCTVSLWLMYVNKFTSSYLWIRRKVEPVLLSVLTEPLLGTKRKL